MDDNLRQEFVNAMQKYSNPAVTASSGLSSSIQEGNNVPGFMGTTKASESRFRKVSGASMMSMASTRIKLSSMKPMNVLRRKLGSPTESKAQGDSSFLGSIFRSPSKQPAEPTIISSPSETCVAGFPNLPSLRTNIGVITRAPVSHTSQTRVEDFAEIETVQGRQSDETITATPTLSTSFTDTKPLKHVYHRKEYKSRVTGLQEDDVVEMFDFAVILGWDDVKRGAFER